MKAAIPLLIAVFVLPILHAQPFDLGYEPPEGWEYIRSLDSYYKVRTISADRGGLLMLGDTSAEFRRVFMGSVDDGKTWKEPRLRLDETYSRYAINFIPNTTKLWLWGQRKDSVFFAISEDFGKSFDVMPLPAGQTADFIRNGNLPVLQTVNPLRPEEYFCSIRKVEGRCRFNCFLRTTDGGGNWHPAPFPDLKVGAINEEECEIHVSVFMDHSRNGHWYVVQGFSLMDHLGAIYSGYNLHRTRDAGLSYGPYPALFKSKFIESLTSGNRYLGIGQAGELRWQWENPSKSVNLRHYDQFDGFQTLNENGKLREHNWLDAIHPGRSGKDSAYQHTIRRVEFFDANPGKSIVHIVEISTLPKDREKRVQRDWLYLAHGDAAEVKLLWESENHPLISAFAIDKQRAVVWVVTRDSEYNALDPAERPRLRLWRRQLLISSVQDSTNGINDDLHVVPNPVNDGFHLSSASIRNDKEINIDIFNVEGVKISNFTIVSSAQELQDIPLSLPPHCAAGVYVLRVSDGREVYSTQLVKSP